MGRRYPDFLLVGTGFGFCAGVAGFVFVGPLYPARLSTNRPPPFDGADLSPLDPLRFDILGHLRLGFTYESRYRHRAIRFFYGVCDA